MLEMHCVFVINRLIQNFGAIDFFLFALGLRGLRDDPLSVPWKFCAHMNSGNAILRLMNDISVHYDVSVLIARGL
jgi:hypothetical protein